MRSSSPWLSVLLVLAAGLAPAPGSAAGVPRGVHLSFTDDSRTTATVTWLTDGTDSPAPVVEHGSSPDALDTVVAATSEPVPRMKALVHTATLRGLTAGETVHYRVSGTSGSSPVYSFETAPAGDSFSFVAIGDMGTSPQAHRTTTAVLAEDPDLVVHAGDLSYANGNDPVWDTWLNVIEPFAARIPYMTAPGNHEYESFPKGWSSFLSRMSMPGEELWFSFDFANVHFLALQSYDVAHNSQGTLDEMMLFAEQDLQEAAARRDRGEIDHIIVLQHHPLYGNQQGGLDRQRNAQWIALEEQLFHRFDIDLVIVGHNHHYERSKPMIYGVPTSLETAEHHDPAGWVEIITGGAGAGLYSFAPPEQFQPWSAAWAKRFHITAFEVSGKEIRMRAIATDQDPGVFDTWVLKAG